MDHDTSPSNNNAIANIGALLGRRRMSQKTLARALDMSQAAISDRQRGVTPWSLQELDHVAELFAVPAATLLLPEPSGAVPFQGGSVGAAPIAQLAELRTFNPKCAPSRATIDAMIAAAEAYANTAVLS
jgi:transcriptional regulator with XRE-family HTH domain